MLGGHPVKKHKGRFWMLPPQLGNWLEDRISGLNQKDSEADSLNSLLNRLVGAGGPAVFSILMALTVCFIMFSASRSLQERELVVDITETASVSADMAVPQSESTSAFHDGVPRKGGHSPDLHTPPGQSNSSDVPAPLEGSKSEKPDDAIGRALKKLRSDNGGGKRREQGRDCSAGRLYVYDMPSKFNVDVVRECTADTIYCWKLQNLGMGAKLQDGSPESSDVTEELFGSCPGCWYNTRTYVIEHPYHFRMLQHPCRTENPEEAAIFYIPFYISLALDRVISNPDYETRNRLGNEALEWLQTMPYVTRNGGHDHFIVLGTLGYVFHKKEPETDCSDWLTHPLTTNFTRLSFDKDLWDNKFSAIPYPTSFHPSTDEQLHDWQEHVRRHGNRRTTVTYVGSKGGNSGSNDAFDFRVLLMEQCEAWERCVFLNCDHNKESDPCRRPVAPLREYINADFCLEPRGDTASRKSTFDAMLAGCIPVFFSIHSAYNAYHWFLPLESDTWSVLVDEKEVVAGNVTIKEALSKYTQEQIQAMRSVIIDTIIPRIVYANPMDYRYKDARDAVDRAVQGMLHLVSRYKAGLPDEFPSYWDFGPKPQEAWARISDLYPGPTDS